MTTPSTHFLALFRSYYPGGLVVKNPPANAGDLGLIPGSGRSHKEENWLPTPVFLPGEFHGPGHLVGYSPWGLKRIGYNTVTKLH